MATTATNKQPLLVDHVLHFTIAGNTLTSGSATSLDIEGTNQSAVLVDSTGLDGAIVEDLYVISRTTTSTKYTVLFYLSSSVDYLRPSEGVFIGQVESAETAGTITSSTELPKVLAPLPHAGTESQVRALYVPRGKALWCTIQSAGPINTSDTPIIGAQGGYY